MKYRSFIPLILIMATILILMVSPASSVQTSNTSISSSGLVNYPDETRPMRLHTDGRWIKDQNNNTIFLRGINKYSLEYRPDGAHWVESDWDTMKSWGANVVRVIFNKDWWDNNIATNDGMLYRQKIQQAVEWGKERGIYTIIGMVWWSYSERLLPMPPDVYAWVETWKEIASTYKDEPYTIFSIWGEPHDIPELSWHSAAQQCVSGIRGTGAENIIIIGTLAWSDDVSFVQSLGPISGGNIVYSFHKYLVNIPSRYPTTVNGIKSFLVDNGWKWLLDNNVAPFIIEEFGGYPAESNELEYMRILTRMANGLENDSTDWRAGYIAWAFNPYDPYQLVEADFVTPTTSGEVLINAIKEG